VRTIYASRSESVFQCVVVWCSVVQCGAAWCSVVRCGAVRCGVMQCGTVWCSVAQCVAICCSMLQSHYLHTQQQYWRRDRCCWCTTNLYSSTLLCVAVCCVCYSMLQCIAVCCTICTFERKDCICIEISAVGAPIILGVRMWRRDSHALRTRHQNCSRRADLLICKYTGIYKHTHVHIYICIYIYSCRHIRTIARTCNALRATLWGGFG